eukprot:Em0012g780a
MSNRYVYLDTTAQLSFETLQAKLLGELNVPRISMMYTDEEGDNVSIGSQEELDEAMTAAGGPNDLLCIRVYTQGGEAHVAQRGSGGHYSQLAQMVGAGRKVSAEEGGKPKWFTPAMSENNAYLLEEINKSFNEALVVLSSIRGTPGSAPGVTGGDREMYVHYAVTCNCCEQAIYGVRYKCGNCVNYDLCESCEARSQEVHCPSHVFLKVKTPTPYSHLSKPLLRRNLYHLTQEGGEEETGSSGQDDGTHTECVQKTREELKEELKQRKLKKRMGAEGAGQTEATPSNVEGTCAAPTYVEKTREELKEEIRRKKQERKLAAHTARMSPHGLADALKHELKVLKMEKKRKRKVAKLQAHGVAIPGMVVGQSCETGAALDEGKSHKGPNKYLAATVVSDRNYPPGSIIPCGQPFEKSWVVANTGTKTWKDVRLVHQVGYTPVSTEIDVPDLKPEEQTILTVEYPPIGTGQGDQITSSWRLIRKGHTPFGPTLWLSVVCDWEASPQATSGTSQSPSAPFTLPLVLIGPSAALSVAQPIQQQQQVEVVVMAPAPQGGPKDQADAMCSSICSERLVQTFELVSQVSQKSSAPASEIDLGDRPCDGDREDQLGASDDEFVVVIPDCFNLDVPLPELTSLRSSKCEEPAGHGDSSPVILNDASLEGSAGICGGCKGGQGDEQAVAGGEGDGSERGEDGCGHESGGGCGECGDGDDGCGSDDDECGGGDDGCGGPVNSDDVVGASGVDITEDGPVPPPQLDAGSSSSSGDRKLLPHRSPPTAVPSGTKFTLQEMTLQRVLDAHITNPITIATGCHQHGPTGPLAEDEEKFEDAPEPSEPRPRSATQQAPPSSTPNSTPQAPHIPSYLDRDVARFLPNSATWEQPKWGGPPTPSTPMDRLIGMGFANRELNSQLLEKHNNNIQAVLNELLDGRDSEAVRV